MEPGTLFIVATPIGNLGDITLRALDTLRNVDRIAAEDTRHTRKLLSHYDIHKPLVSYHSHNANQRGPELLEVLNKGESIALVTDAGTPGISDPGALLIHEAIESGIPVTAIPGPTALIMALISSGLPTHPFAFLGFPPGSGNGRRRFFSSYASLPMTLVLYESPQRLKRTLEDILQYWGNRSVAVARELTKLYEEVFRGAASEAIDHFPGQAKGEITLVVAGASPPTLEEKVECDWKGDLAKLIQDAGMTVKDATEEIVRRYGVSRRSVYREALGIKRDCV